MSLHVALALTNAAAVAAAASSLGGPSQKLSPTDFGGSQPMRIARIGGIEVDLEADRLSSVRRIPCVDAARTTLCYVARATH